MLHTLEGQESSEYKPLLKAELQLQDLLIPNRITTEKKRDLCKECRIRPKAQF